MTRKLLFFIVVFFALVYYFFPSRETFTDTTHYLQVYEPIWKQLRVGRPADGGYVICVGENFKYDLFLSGGINDDVSFEQQFLQMYPEVVCHAFDGTIKGLPSIDVNKNSIVFHKKNLGKINDENTSNLNEYFKQYENIFLKLDIEGGEDDLFEALTDSDLTKIKQLVIEFHSADQQKIPKRLAKTHWLVHFHPNNYQGTKLVNGTTIPKVFECTYVRKGYNENLKFSNSSIPNPEYDVKNNPSSKDIFLKGPPYNQLT
jgi:hypothetical protein